MRSRLQFLLPALMLVMASAAGCLDEDDGSSRDGDRNPPPGNEQDDDLGLGGETPQPPAEETPAPPSDDETDTPPVEAPGSDSTGSGPPGPGGGTNPPPPGSGGAPLACSSTDQPCNSDAQTTDDYFCDTASGRCIPRCNPSNADRTASADCPSGTWCFGVLENGQVSETTGACVAGDCNGTVFAPDCGAGQTCLPVGNNASFCVDAGSGGEGSSCEDLGDCQPGLFCVFGTCTLPCDLRGQASNAATCGNEETCIAAFDTTTINRPGLCGTECEAFSTDQCGEGEQCGLVLGRRGINAWICNESSPNTAGPGESCTVDDGCTEGYLCLNDGSEQSPDLRCRQLCGLGTTAGQTGTCDSLGDPETDGIAATCFPSAVDGLGFCYPQCDPFPRMGLGNYGCEDPGATCRPFRLENTPTSPIDGICLNIDGPERPIGGSCTTEFSLAECEDFGLCIGAVFDEPNRCRQLCAPFSRDQCDTDTACGYIFPINDIWDFSYCEPLEVEGAVPGGVCPGQNSGGLLCGDHALCLSESEFSTTSICTELCTSNADCTGGTCAGIGMLDGIDAPVGICQY